MLSEKIKELLNSELFDELEKLTSETEIKELVSATEKLDSETRVLFLQEIPVKFSAPIFLELKSSSQLDVIENFSIEKFKNFSEEILETEDIEDKLKGDVFNELMLKVKAETRREKLVEIIDDLENRKFGKLKPLLAEMEPIDIAEIFDEVDDEKDVILFRLLPKDLASDVFVNMNVQSQQELIKKFTDSELKNILNDLFIDDTLDIIEEMPSNVVVRILRLSSKESRESINKLLGFPKDSAGSIMTTEFVSLRVKMTAAEALAKIRKQALDKETIYTCYVTDDSKHLLGIVTAKDLILHNPEDIVGDFMEENFVFSTTKTDKEEVSQLLSKYDLLAIPIVDNENRINGIVTVDDAIDVIQEEAAEDISKMAAISPNNKPYLQTSVFKLFSSRIPWLLLLLLSATFTGLIINIYESTLNSLSPLLFACIPMLMGAGGNAGSQASVTIIQSIALNEVSFRDLFKVLWKEIRISIVVAFVLSVACFGKLLLIDNLIFGYDYSVKISLVVSLALFATICISKIIGAFLPMLAKKCKLDPAVVASPFITTLVDIISLIIYCGFSVWLLS